MRLPYTDLNLGFSNAENYKRRENKQLLDKYFVRDAILERLLDPNIFYLVGEKGTGKTAYATFLANHDYKETKAVVYDVRKSEYLKLLELKRAGHLPLSRFADVWRTVLYLAASVAILDHYDKGNRFWSSSKMSSLRGAINEFFEGAFAPEIVSMISFVQESERSGTIMAKHLGSGATIKRNDKQTISDNDSRFQNHLLRIRREFEEALSSAKLTRRELIFLDGIDIRPPDVAYSDYFECVSGLIEAVWAVNTDFFANVRDSSHRIRVILLVRPDTLLATGLHNLNTKLKDNCVVLDWSTAYKDYRGSHLFNVADRLLASQQPDFGTILPGAAWDHYFPFQSKNISSSSEVNSFLAFLRFSYYRPRDIISMMTTLQDLLRRKHGSAAYVTNEDFRDPSFRDAHAEYLLGEIRDQLLFYYSSDEYELFLQFFLHLEGRQSFTYEQFVHAYDEFVHECATSNITMPRFFESANIFLQFLYELNVICYKEHAEPKKYDNKEPFIRWCFRERTNSHMRPKVRYGVEYEIFYGLSKALNVGRIVVVRGRPPKRLVGSIVTLNFKKGFGFIRGGANHADYYFKCTELPGTLPVRVGQRVSFRSDVKHGELQAIDIKIEQPVRPRNTGRR